jgi:hypothetical protein
VASYDCEQEHGRNETALERLDRNLQELLSELRIVVTGVTVPTGVAEADGRAADRRDRAPCPAFALMLSPAVPPMASGRPTVTSRS